MKNKWHKIIIILFFLLSLTVAGFLHGYNMLHFPYYESDEGTYTSQAWSIVRMHTLTPYTYWYDHPPLGWALLALWHISLPREFFTFGSSIDTGRVFMLLVHIISASLIYYIVFRLTKRVLPAFLAVVIFSISPLAIYFQRRVLLDNIMVMWILLSTAVLYIRYEKLRLITYVLSGIFFSLAVLTKITAVMFGPALLYLVWTHSSPIERFFRVTVWLMSGILLTSIYLLGALLRGEFFPGPDHVSFIGALEFQASRTGGLFYKPTSEFYMAVIDWLKKDAMLVYIMPVVAFLGIIVSFFKKNLIFFMLTVLLYFLFLIRGGVIINFYILPLIPFIAILAVLSWHYIVQFISRFTIIYQFIFLLTIGAVGYYYYDYASHDIFWRDETTNQKEAVQWIKRNLPENSAILIDVYAFTDLHDSHYINTNKFNNADWYYKVSRDKEIGEKKYNYDWRNFNYILLTHEMLKQVKDGDDNFIKVAFQNALPEKKWVKNTHAFIDEQKFLSTNGDWAMLFKINDNTQTELKESWLTYKKKYIKSYGQVIDPVTGLTTSSGQGNVMLRAVIMNDQETFKGVWFWTKDHLQYRVQDKLFSSAWQNDKVLKSDNSSSADGDIALALLFAYKEWGNESYLNEAKNIINEIWRQEIREIDGHYYLLATNELSAQRGDKNNIQYLVKPAYFSPAWYRIFATVDKEHNWNQVADDTYVILEKLNNLSWQKSIVPDEFIISSTNGGISQTKPPLKPELDEDMLKLKDSKQYEKFDLFWRLAVDREWFKSERSQQYFDKINSYLEKTLQEKTRIEGELNTQTMKVIKSDNAVSIQFGYIMSLRWSPKEKKTHNYYDQNILTQYDYLNNSWRGDRHYQNDTLGWLIMAIYNNTMPNLWNRNILSN